MRGSVKFTWSNRSYLTFRVYACNEIHLLWILDVVTDGTDIHMHTYASQPSIVHHARNGSRRYAENLSGLLLLTNLTVTIQHIV